MKSNAISDEPRMVQNIELTELDASEKRGARLLGENLDLVRNVRVRLTVAVGRCEMTIKELFERVFRPGDIYTHAYAGGGRGELIDGRVNPAIFAAQKKGIIFDIGHGMGSFSFATARTMLSNGFAPDCISSDVHALCIDGPAFDLLTTMSKFLCLGMPLADVIQAATEHPAHALRRSELGTFKAGSAGDATLLSLEEGSFDFVDSTGARLNGRSRLVSQGVVIGGKIWHRAGQSGAA